MDRDQALAIVREHVAQESLIRHMLAVEAAMRAYAPDFGGDPEEWGIAGLLHDADYEAWPDEHPARIVAWLRERGEEAIAHAVSAHYTKWGVAHESALDRALLACDELTGFVGACALVRPDGIATLESRSVLKKLKDRGFAAKVERGEVSAGAERLGVELGEHVAFVIGALRPHAAELGLGRRSA